MRAALKLGFGLAAVCLGVPDGVPAGEISLNHGDDLTPFTQRVFDRENLLIDNGNGYADDTNLGGTYTWGTSAINLGYLQLYRVTGDECYLQRFIRQYDQVLMFRDDVSNHLPENAPAWSEGPRFPNYVSAPISSGNILVPMVVFARLVNEDAVLSGHPFYVAKVAEYLARARETIDWLNANFLISAGPNRLSYSPNLGGRGGRDAVHVDATMMRVQYDYYRATGDAAMLSNADRLARTIRDIAIYTNAAGVLTWQYGYDGPPDPDDCSHGAYAGPHIARIIRDHGVVTELQGQGLARALIEQAFMPDGLVTPGIDGTPYLERSNSVSSGHWSWGYAGGLIDLCQFDMRLIPICEIVQFRNWGLSTSWPEFGPGKLGWPLLGIANLVRYSVVPQVLQLEMVVGNGSAAWRTAGPVHIGLLAPEDVALARDDDPGDIVHLSGQISGRGDEWVRWWEFALDLDASAASALHGQSVVLTASFLDNYANTKNVIAVQSSPATYGRTIGPDGESVTFAGVLTASQRFVLQVGEDTVIQSPGWVPWTTGDCCIPLVPADLDCDDDVDLSDFGRVQLCLAGPFKPIPSTPAGCARADLNGDDHVDHLDTAILLACLSGANVPMDPGCME